MKLLRKFIYTIAVFALCFSLTGCGDDSENTVWFKQGNIEETLYLAYAGITKDQEMNGLLINDFDVLAVEIGKIIQQEQKDGGYTLADGSSIDLSSPSVTAPTGMSGTINISTFTATANSGGIVDYTASINLSDYVNGSQTYKGAVTISTNADPAQVTVSYPGGISSAATIKHQKHTIVVSNNPIDPEAAVLSVKTSGRSYKEALYAVWSMAMSDGSAQVDYTLNGLFRLDDKIEYLFSGLSYVNTNSILAIDGFFTIDDDRFLLSGDNVASDWLSGNLTLSARDLNGTVELRGDDAIFVARSIDHWTKEDWRSDKLMPRVPENSNDNSSDPQN